MDDHGSDQSAEPIALPTGWSLLDRLERSGLTFLEFQRDGRSGPRVSAVGVTFDEALANGLDRMLLYDERDRQRGVR